jgi:phosphoinositide-3-kinase, regulatory subunit 4
MKSYLMKVDDTSVAVKVYFKSQDEDLETYAATLTWMWNALSPSQHPNLLPYQMWIKSSAKISKPNLSPVFLVRQYFPANLYDRLSTRPFLSDLEKLWVIYQLMRAVEEAHEEGVVHGDIKPENIMVTSWNWIVLTDFAPYKPVQIPDDDPTDFHYFFDSMGRRRCYVAPERFYKSTLTKSEHTADEGTNAAPNGTRPNVAPADILQASMDVFSLGCTLAEVFPSLSSLVLTDLDQVLLDGEPLLDLPSMLKYKSCCEEPASSGSVAGSLGAKESTLPLMTSLADPESPALSTLNRIQDERIREVIAQMTQHAPCRRMPVKTYRADLETSGVFPSYFGSTLYELFLSIHWRGATPDDRVGIICQVRARLPPLLLLSLRKEFPQSHEPTRWVRRS